MRGAGRHRHSAHHRAGVFGGYKCGGSDVHEEKEQGNTAGHQSHGEIRANDEAVHTFLIFLQQVVVELIESFDEAVGEEAQHRCNSDNPSNDGKEDVFEGEPAQNHHHNGCNEQNRCHQRWEGDGKATLLDAVLFLHQVECLFLGHLHAFAQTLVVTVGFEDDGTKSRRKGQSVEGREANGHCHGDTKLPIERTAGASHKGYGHKHSHHHEGNRDDSSSEFAHRVK